MPVVGTGGLGRGLGGLGRLAPGGEPLRPRAWRVLAGEPFVDVDEVVHAEIPPRLRRCAGEGQMTVPGQEDHLITSVDARRLVGREDDRDPSPGESAQQVHDLRRRCWVQTRSGFIQEQGARLGEHLNRDAGPLALTARQHPDRDVTPIGQVQVAHRFVNRSVGLVGGCAGR